MQKGFAHLFLIIAVLLIGGLVTVGFYIFKNQQKLPTNQEIQKTSQPSPLVESKKLPEFLDQNLGFKFAYPESFKVVKDSEEEFDKRGMGNYRKNFTNYIGYEPPKFIDALAVFHKSSNIDSAPFTLWVFENPDSLSHDSWYKKYWYYPFVWGDFTNRADAYAPLKDIKVDEHPGKYGIITYRPNNPRFIHVAFGDKMFLFKTINVPEGIEGQILESFDFSK
ncbi:hypothetical protein HYS97_02185 [Candidatus Daviesbacteria bacterium]|nr:hypothetical protein [Candidatus Daviesbacteria bacterium]